MSEKPSMSKITMTSSGQTFTYSEFVIISPPQWTLLSGFLTR